MRKAQFLGFSLLLTSVLFLQNSFAQDYTRWELPEGAKSRFGKGLITGNIEYSPDDRKLAVGSSIGVWLYDAAQWCRNQLVRRTYATRYVAWRSLLMVPYLPVGVVTRRSDSTVGTFSRSVKSDEHVALDKLPESVQSGNEDAVSIGESRRSDIHDLRYEWVEGSNAGGGTSTCRCISESQPYSALGRAERRRWEAEYIGAPLMPGVIKKRGRSSYKNST